MIPVEQGRQAEGERDEDPESVELQDRRVRGVDLEKRGQKLETVAPDDFGLAEVRTHDPAEADESRETLVLTGGHRRDVDDRLFAAIEA